MNFDFNLGEVKKYISDSSPETRIYIGADSERNRRGGEWYADYTVAVVVHVDGKHGCKVFGEISTEKDYDRKKSRPSIRLMKEVMKACQMYINLVDSIGDRHCEVHLDINPNILHGSSCVINEAIGYVKGMCSISPKVKPSAFAATYAADRLKELVR